MMCRVRERLLAKESYAIPEISALCPREQETCAIRFLFVCTLKGNRAVFPVPGPVSLLPPKMEVVDCLEQVRGRHEERERERERESERERRVENCQPSV